jgi:hypothetical protein
MAEAFVTRTIGLKNCENDKELVGKFSTKYDYIVKSVTGDDVYPTDEPFIACPPWLHYNVKVGNLQADINILAGANVTASDVVTSNVYSLNAKAAIWDSKKSFDIPHPSKKDHRLRYICIEGPQADVYYRGKLSNESVIHLPDYWRDLVDVETIGVSLTPIGKWQELFVEKIEWGTQIYIKNNSGSSIHCDYVVYGERKDTTKNIPEYAGNSPDDYPGNNQEYVINGKNEVHIHLENIKEQLNEG